MSARRLVFAALVLGTLLRVAALPILGAGDVGTFKLWSNHAAADGGTRLYGADSPPQDTIFTLGDYSADTDYPPLALFELGLVGRIIKSFFVLFGAGFVALAFVAVRRAHGDDRACWAVTAWWLIRP